MFRNRNSVTKGKNAIIFTFLYNKYQIRPLKIIFNIFYLEIFCYLIFLSYFCIRKKNSNNKNIKYE